MKSMLRFAALIAIALSLASHAVSAQEFHHNVYGMYAAPTIYGLAKGSEYNLASSGGTLDVGLYYARAFTDNFSTRVEVRYGTRALDYAALTKAPLPGVYTIFRFSEQILEIPVVLQADRRMRVSDHDLTVSVGGGFSTKFVLDQKLLVPSGEYDGNYAPIPADSYRKVGLLVDGGATFQVVRTTSIFARLRFDVDLATAGEPDDADVITRLWETGFYAGFEYGF